MIGSVTFILLVKWLAFPDENVDEDEIAFAEIEQSWVEDVSLDEELVGIATSEIAPPKQTFVEEEIAFVEREPKAPEPVAKPREEVISRADLEQELVKVTDHKVTQQAQEPTNGTLQNEIGTLVIGEALKSEIETLVESEVKEQAAPEVKESVAEAVIAVFEEDEPVAQVEEIAVEAEEIAVEEIAVEVEEIAVEESEPVIEDGVAVFESEEGELEPEIVVVVEESEPVVEDEIAAVEEIEPVVEDETDVAEEAFVVSEPEESFDEAFVSVELEEEEQIAILEPDDIDEESDFEEDEIVVLDLDPSEFEEVIAVEEEPAPEEVIAVVEEAPPEEVIAVVEEAIIEEPTLAVVEEIEPEIEIAPVEIEQEVAAFEPEELIAVFEADEAEFEEEIAVVVEVPEAPVEQVFEEEIAAIEEFPEDELEENSEMIVVLDLPEVEEVIAVVEEVIAVVEEAPAEEVIAVVEEVLPEEVIAVVEEETIEEPAIAAVEESIPEEEIAELEEEIAFFEVDEAEFIEEVKEIAMNEVDESPESVSVELKGLILVDSKENLLAYNDLVDIRGVNVSGILLPGSLSQLERTLEPIYLNQELTPDKIKEIKNAISRYYEEYYDPFVLVEVPAQNISSGVLQLVVVQGKVGGISVKGNKYFSSNRLMKYLHTKPGDEINLYNIQRDLDLINRNPFRRVNVIYAPGKEFGTTDLVLAVDDSRPIRVYCGADNSGVASINRQRLYAGLSFGNFLWLDEVFSYQYTTSYDFKSFQGHTGQYMAPLPCGHLINMYGGYSTVEPPLPFLMVKNKGTTAQTSFRYIMPIKTHPRTTQEWSVGFDYKFTNNTILYSEQIENFGNYLNLTQFVMEYKRHQEVRTARFDYDLQAYYSPGEILPHQEDSRFNKLRNGARNTWFYMKGSFRYLQALPKNFQLSLWLQGQWTSASLLPSEQFGLGGYSSVRGYDERQLSMDSAFLSSLEIRSPLIPLVTMFRSSPAKDALQFLGFLDYGWGHNNHSVATEPNMSYLLGIGPGLRYTLDPYVSVRLDWGIKLHNAALFTGGASEVHFNVNLSY
jgi:hemolysin activation/secretion protein